MTELIAFAVTGQRDQVVSATSPLPVSSVGGGGSTPTYNADGSLNNGGVNGTSRATAANPVPVVNEVGGSPVSDSNPFSTQAAQSAPAFTAVTFAANTASVLMTASATRQGARILNYGASPLYFFIGTTGTPGAGNADVIPAAASGLPGQYEFPYRPVGAYWAVTATAATGATAVVVETW